MLSSEVLLALFAGAGALAAPGVAGMLFGSKGVESGETRTEALWTSEMSSIAPEPRLEGERKVDLAIIGGGYTGLSCAYYMKKFRPDWSVAYNGLGIMPGHNTGYLSACRITGHPEEDMRYMLGRKAQIPIPGEFYRSMVLKPVMKLMTPA